MQQYYRSASLEGLEYQEKYNLQDYTDVSQPLVIFGMYRQEDFDLVSQHKGELTIVWQGSDALNLPDEWAAEIRERGAKNIAISHWIFDVLTNHWLDPTLKYLSATSIIPELDNVPNGDFVHFYTSMSSPDNARYLGEHLIPSIIEKTKIPIIQTAFGLYDRSELFDIYKKCFIHLRLTTFDGCPNTNLEMGLMGRKSIYNCKGMPASIPWIDANHVADIILAEYETRKNDNSQVTKEVQQFIINNTL
jgi:hypothetical protein